MSDFMALLDLNGDVFIQIFTLGYIFAQKSLACNGYLF